MKRLPPRSTRTETLFPDTTLVRSPGRRGRPAVVHAVGLQLYGLGRAADRHRRDAGVQQRLYRLADRQPADVGGDARAAGVCAGAELRHQQALDRRRTGAVLGLCRGDGPVDVDDLSGLYRLVDRDDFLRDRGGLPWPQPLWRSEEHTSELQSLM